MSDLGDMLAYHIGKTIIALVLTAAIVCGGIGFLIGKFL
jgi:hypothetical protein